MSRGWDYVQRLEHNIAVLGKGSRVCAERVGAMLMLVKVVVNVWQRRDVEVSRVPDWRRSPNDAVDELPACFCGATKNLNSVVAFRYDSS